MRTIGATPDAEADGQHFFKDPEAATIIENALLHFDGERYRLLAWCVKSNHMHVMAQQLEGWPLANVVHSWKSFTANGVNRLLGRSGPLWQREYFDRSYAMTIISARRLLTSRTMQSRQASLKRRKIGAGHPLGAGRWKVEAIWRSGILADRRRPMLRNRGSWDCWVFSILHLQTRAILPSSPKGRRRCTKPLSLGDAV